MPDDIERMDEMFNLLLGDDLQGRKDYVAQFGADYIELVDVS